MLMVSLSLWILTTYSKGIASLLVFLSGKLAVLDSQLRPAVILAREATVIARIRYSRRPNL